MIPALLALVISALFTGAALYILIAEQPARLLIPEPALLVQWRRAYHGGTAMQASLAVAGFLCGALAWWLTGRLGFFGGGLVLVANWPYTLVVIMPVNRRSRRSIRRPRGRRSAPWSSAGAVCMRAALGSGLWRR